MKWNYIMDEQPLDGEMIVQINRPYGDHYPIGIRKYDQKCSFEKVIKFYQLHGMPGPDFWWMLAKDFPFPDKI